MPTVPFGNEIVLILGVVFIVMDRDFVAIALVMSVTWKVTAVGPPAVVGVPETAPPELNYNPTGRVSEAIDQG